MKQTHKILNHLQTHGSSTVREMQRALDINNVTAAISVLRDEGWNFNEIYETNADGVRYKRYFKPVNIVNRIMSTSLETPSTEPILINIITGKNTPVFGNTKAMQKIQREAEHSRRSALANLVQIERTAQAYTEECEAKKHPFLSLFRLFKWKS